jgi:hypothetical protein
MNCLTVAQPTSALSRREKHVARLLPKVEALLTQRSQASPVKDGFRFEPLAVLVRDLGYKLTEKHPFGNRDARTVVTDALHALGRAGPFIVEVHKVEEWLFMQPRNPNEDHPVPRGVMRDPVRVAYWMKDPSE